MSSATQIESGEKLEPLPANPSPTLSTRWEAIERYLVYAGDWLNPILVKETRQALKSFQFTTTFVLVLVACWVVTIGGLALIGPSVFYSASGGMLLAWYYAVLAFPLIVVVPYSAFRSLASEREDNTYDLLSITALRPRQIISGKLGSAVVQMGVYFSAITPCLAFTYLLRGVDLPTIAVLMGYTFFGSLGLSMLGILLATLSEQKFAQVFVSVAFVALLLMVLWSVIAAGYQMIQYSYALFGGNEFWVFTAAVATAYGTTFGLMYFAAAGMITFATENRSTPLRICMLVQQAAWIGWMAYAWIMDEFRLGAALAMVVVAALYWMAMGALLTSERSEMSHRVRRRLPKSFLGRVFLSWLNPGPATGYMFVVANTTALVLLGFMAAMVHSAHPTTSWPSGEEYVAMLIVGWSYLVAYLGLGMLAVRLLRLVSQVNLFAGLLIHFLLVLAGSGIPLTIQMMSVEMRQLEYSFLQITNPFWTLRHLGDNWPVPEAPALMLLVPTAAICMLLVNMPTVARALQAVRVNLPTRVIEDEAALNPSPEALPQNPWDEPVQP